MSGDALGEVGRLAHMLVDADRKVEDAEVALAGAKENARRLREEALPGALQELGIDEIVLSDGAKITMGLEVYCSISADNKGAALRWLEENAFGGLIKTTVALPFGRSDEEKAELAQLRSILDTERFTYTEEQGVHAGTLKAWLKEQLRGGPDTVSVPLQLFGARPVTVAKVKLPKGN